MDATGEQAAQLQRAWETDPRWAGITRDYSAQDVIRLRGRVAGEHSLARRGASRLWDLLHRPDATPTLGAVVGDQAAGAARTGLPAIYLPGWQAGDASPAGGGYPGQSPHPDNPMPHLVRRINNALLSQDLSARAESAADDFAPGRRRRPGQGRPPSTCRAGRRAAGVWPGAAIPVSRRTRATRCRGWSAGSTTRC